MVSWGIGCGTTPGLVFFIKWLIKMRKAKERKNVSTLGPDVTVVVVYHVTIVAIGHELLKKFWPFW